MHFVVQVGTKTAPTATRCIIKAKGTTRLLILLKSSGQYYFALIGSSEHARSGRVSTADRIPNSKQLDQDIESIEGGK